MAETPNPQQSQVERSVFAGYAGEQMPLTAYTGFLAVYLGLFGTFLFIVRSTVTRLPERMGPGDILLFGIATHKVGRLVTRDWVTSPLRAPFTTYEKGTGGGEVAEKPRGQGFRLAMGQLLTCPWCVAPWIAAGLSYIWVFAPRLARLVASLFTMVAISDYLQHVYQAAKKLNA